MNIIGDSFGAAIVEHLSRDDLLQVEFESRDPQSELLYPLATRYTPQRENYGGVPVRYMGDDNANQMLMDKDKMLDENLSDHKPRLTETTF